MKTSKAFSFISYNSRAFLDRVLHAFVDDKLFYRCAAWFHESLGEEKDHFHCYIEPQREIDTSTLSERFIELDDNGNKQSIAIRPKCSSKFVDAYLYGIHDSDYLSYKGRIRELVNIHIKEHIYIGDFKNDIEDANNYKFRFCLSPYARLYDMVIRGKTLEDVLNELRIPFSQFYAVSNAYRMIRHDIYEQEQKLLTENEEE